MRNFDLQIPYRKVFFQHAVLSKFLGLTLLSTVSVLTVKNGGVVHVWGVLFSAWACRINLLILKIFFSEFQNGPHTRMKSLVTECKFRTEVFSMLYFQNSCDWHFSVLFSRTFLVLAWDMTVGSLIRFKTIEISIGNSIVLHEIVDERCGWFEVEWATSRTILRIKT